MKQNIFVILLFVTTIVGFYVVGVQDQSPAIQEKEEDVIDLSKISVDERKRHSNRYSLLTYMTETDTENYLKNQTYFLDDNDPSTKVIIGTYGADDYGDDGGIIMLRHLPDGRFSLYWEITSPMLWAPAYPRKIVEDINGDGLKELVTRWGSYLNDARDVQITEYWIFTLNPHNKTYRLLNPIIDKERNEIKNFNFSDSIGGEYINRFQTNGIVPDVVQDIDNDGISEIVIKQPAENMLLFGRPPEISGMGPRVHIHKWNGSEYYLWKEIAESDPEFSNLLNAS